MDFKEFKEFTGIEAETPEEFRELFQKQYIKRSAAHTDKEIRTKISGTIYKAQTDKIKNLLTENEIDTTSDDFVAASEKFEDFVSLGLTKLKEKKQAEIEELKLQKGSTNEEAIKLKEAEIEKVRAKLKDTEKAWKTAVEENKNKETEWMTKLKSRDITVAKEEARKKLKIKSTLTEVEKIGLEAAIERELRFDIDDEGKPFVTNAEGNRIPSKAKASEFISIDEAMQSVVDKLDLAPKNPNGGKPYVQNVGGQQPPKTDTPPAANAPKLHPNAMR